MRKYIRKNRIDLTNKIFGKWTVKHEANERLRPDGHFERLWRVVCECGTEKEIATSRLTSGESTGCRNHGSTHLKRREYKVFNQFPHNIMDVFRRYKRGAKERNLVFDLSFDIWYKLSQGNCYYCGSGLSNINRPNKACREFGTHIKDFIYNGIDRVDNNQGYTIDNVVSCCSKCNRAKLDIPREEFLGWIERVYKHSIAKGFGEP